MGQICHTVTGNFWEVGWGGDGRCQSDFKSDGVFLIINCN